MDQRRISGVLSHDGFNFITRTSKNGSRYLMCKKFRKLHCLASGKVNPDGDFVITNGNHNHPREDADIEGNHFKRQLKEACLHQRGNLKNIYESIASRNPDSAVFVPYNSVRSSMRRWRHATTPNIPENLEGLAEIFQTGTVVVGDGHRAVIFGNTQFINNFRDSQYTFVDGTFKAVPRRPGFTQILTIFATCMDHAFPIVHIFMERKTRALYEAVFNYISNEFPNFINNTVVTDYEVALVEALKASYPQATMHGCFFHYCQAILRKAKMLGVVREIENNVEGRLLLKKYYALALLPAAMIAPAFNSLWETTPELNATFRRLHDYVRRQWIEHVTPEHFSVFQQRHRTNNVMESYHRRLNSKLTNHPAVWDLMETLIDIQNTASIELVQLERQGRVFRVANKNVVFNTRLNEAWSKLADGRFTVGDFLRQAVHMVEGLHMNLHVWNAEIPVEEEVRPLAPAAPPLQLEIPNNNPPNALNEPPPLLYFNNFDQPATPAYNVPPLLPLIPGPVVSNEPPPLLYFEVEETPDPRLRPPTTIPPQPNPNIILQPAYAVPVFEPEAPVIDPIPDPALEFIELPTVEELQVFPPDNPHSPNPSSPNYNFPPIPEAVGRLFAQFNDDDYPEFENAVQRRWEPEIPATIIDEQCLADNIKCTVCYLHKVQYVMPECGHTFCSLCADRLFNVQAPKCAICRASLTVVPQKFYLN